MVSGKSNGQYEVLSPWAEVDPIPLKGLAPRVTDLAGKKIGLLCNNKRAGRPILTVVEEQLKKRYPNSEISWFNGRSFSVSEFEKDRMGDFEAWINNVDAIVAAVAD